MQAAMRSDALMGVSSPQRTLMMVQTPDAQCKLPTTENSDENIPPGPGMPRRRVMRDDERTCPGQLPQSPDPRDRAVSAGGRHRHPLALRGGEDVRELERGSREGDRVG